MNEPSEARRSGLPSKEAQDILARVNVLPTSTTKPLVNICKNFRGLVLGSKHFRLIKTTCLDIQGQK